MFHGIFWAASRAGLQTRRQLGQAVWLSICGAVCWKAVAALPSKQIEEGDFAIRNGWVLTKDDLRFRQIKR